MSDDFENNGFKKLTTEQRQRNEHLVEGVLPEGIIYDGGCPTDVEYTINHTIMMEKKIKKQQPKNLKKAAEMRGWLLDDMHKSLNPKNMGKYEQIIIENPNFDATRPTTSTASNPFAGDNPFFTQQLQHMYQPTKYKENTIAAEIDRHFKAHDETLKQVRDVAKEYQKKMEEAEKAMRAAQGFDGSNAVTPETVTDNLISFESDEEYIIN